MPSLVLPAGSPTAEGFLTKQSHWLKEWRRRYFALHGDQLFFSSAKGGVPHGVIDLSQCLTIKSADDKTRRAHSFEIATPAETFFLFADSEAQKDEWIGAVGRAIVLHSRAAYMRDAEDDD